MRDTDEAASSQEQIEKQLAELCDRNREALLRVVRLIMANQPAQGSADNHGEEIRQTIARIKSKDFISANEAAVLFGCSPQHLRNLVQRAIDGEATEPIPFRDLDGVVTFPLPELIEWTRRPKERARKRTPKNKAHLQAVAS
jgi:hypothetical protein